MNKVSVIQRIGFGGGCHWCTEAVFQALKGVQQVEQGWIASTGIENSFSEAVIVHFDAAVIDLSTLTAIHLSTHSSSSQHALRDKYRSAVYTFDEQQVELIQNTIKGIEAELGSAIVTRVLPFDQFRKNKEQYLNYYKKHADNQFCTTYISPKLNILKRRFAKQVNAET